MIVGAKRVTLCGQSGWYHGNSLPSHSGREIFICNMSLRGAAGRVAVKRRIEITATKQSSVRGVRLLRRKEQECSSQHRTCGGCRCDEKIWRHNARKVE